MSIAGHVVGTSAAVPSGAHDTSTVAPGGSADVVLVPSPVAALVASPVDAVAVAETETRMPY